LRRLRRRDAVPAQIGGKVGSLLLGRGNGCLRLLNRRVQRGVVHYEENLVCRDTGTEIHSFADNASGNRRDDCHLFVCHQASVGGNDANGVLSVRSVDGDWQRLFGCICLLFFFTTARRTDRDYRKERGQRECRCPASVAGMRRDVISNPSFHGVLLQS